jgi:hypothetical protein
MIAFGLHKREMNGKEDKNSGGKVKQQVMIPER